MKTLAYGRVQIQSHRCPSCRREAFVFSGKMSCCGIQVTKDALGWKRMSPCPDKRVALPQAVKDFIVFHQNNRCYYCNLDFKVRVYRRGVLLKRVIAFDHFVPFSFAGDKKGRNIVAACSLCNGIKSWLMFHDEFECIEYILKQWRAKGYSVEQPIIELSELRPVV